jgi:hypothetical protein
MVCEEKVDNAGKLAWIEAELEAEPMEQDAPISVWWDDPPGGEEDDGYASIKAGIGRGKLRTPRT